jgi:hypothetical protein
MLDADADWQQFGKDLERLRAAIRKTPSVNVNKIEVREDAVALVQTYFRAVRPHILNLLGSEQATEPLDYYAQHLLQLAQGRNARSSYVALLGDFSHEWLNLAWLREKALGDVALVHPAQPKAFSRTELRILDTLKATLPNSAKSYEQALRDLEEEKLSYRGTAVELREVVREVLDHLAPDEPVVKSDGFKLEAGQQKPTMRQKARFILASRDLPASVQKPAEQAADVVDESIARFVRSTYVRGSASTHSAQSRFEVEKLKTYVDAVLTELLVTG